VMTRYRNKLVYDSSTGEVRDDRNQMSMLEDFWLPRREGGRGTEITTLGGGQNLGELEDVKYFQNKLYQSLNIPVSRLESESGFNLGRSTEIIRDEVKFTKFIQRLRKRFAELFQDLLKTQLVLKGIITLEDWDKIKESIIYDFIDDNHFSELRDLEILEARMNSLQAMESYIGTYFSKEYIRKYVLRQSETEMEEIDKQIAREKNDEGDEFDGEVQNEPEYGQPPTTDAPYE